MFCEHPTCSSPAESICKSHCHLPICGQHRHEHETNLLKQFEKQLDEYSRLLTNVFDNKRSKFKQTQAHQQTELNSISFSFNQCSLTLDQHLKFSKSTQDILEIKRQDLIQYRNGDKQLTKTIYQEMKKLSNEMQSYIQEQYQLNKQILDENYSKFSWSTNQTSTDVDCIQLSDSDDELKINPVEDDPSLSDKTTIDTKVLPLDYYANLVRDFCPLTELGVYGLKNSHNMRRLCSKEKNKKRYLYIHFICYHSIKPKIAYQLAKAIGNGCNPHETIIFSEDTTSICIENIQCPFDRTAKKFYKKNAIPRTPCSALVNYRHFKRHLRNKHSITKTNIELIYKAMIDYETISHVQFEEDLCENKK